MRDYIDLGFNWRITKAWRYREAMVANVFLEIPVDAKMMRDLEKDMLDVLDGDRYLNHTTYEISDTSGNKLYMTYSDWRLRIGMSVKEETW